MSWAWAFGFALGAAVGRAAYLWARQAVSDWRDALHLAVYVGIHVVVIASLSKGLDTLSRVVPLIVAAADEDADPLPSHGPPRYAVEVAAPAAPVAPDIAPIASLPWASAANPLGDSVAAVVATCDALHEIKGDDLTRDWRPVCEEIAARAPGHGVRPALAVAVAWHESRLYRHAIGALGEVGPLQVRPEMHCGGTCADPIGAGLVVLARYVGRHGEADGMCRYRGAPAGCQSPRVALADAIEGAE